MKIKFFSFVFMLTFILTGTMLLSACGETTPEKTLTSISCEITHEKWNGSQFNYKCTDGINILNDISESNFAVTANYSDNSTASITDFTLDKSQLPQNTLQEGTYTITITFDTKSLNFTVDVSKDQLNVDIETNKELVFDGTEKNIVSEITGLQNYINNGVLVVDEPNSTSSATDAGEYVLKLKAGQGYENDEIVINWKIKPAVVDVPTLKHTNVEYDGNNHSIEFLTALPSYMTLQSNGSYTEENLFDAGVYAYTINLTDGNHTFDENDETKTSETIFFEITKKTLAVNDYGSDDNPLAVSTCTYKENLSLSDLAHNIDTNLFDVDFTWENYAGQNYLTVTPKANTVKNYTWKNGDNIGETEIYVNFEVEKATCDLSGITNIQDNIVFEMVYIGSPINSILADHSKLTESSKTWATTNLKFSENNSTFSVSEENNITLNAGTHVIKNVVYCPNTTNYNDVTISVTITITPAPIVIRNLDWEITSDSFITYDKDTTQNNTLSNFDYYSDSVNVSYTTVYKQTEDASYGEENVTTPKDAGFYKTTATLTATNSNYQVVDEQNKPLSELICEWQIKQQKIQIDLSHSLVLTGSLNERPSYIFAPETAITDIDGYIDNSANFPTDVELGITISTLCYNEEQKQYNNTTEVKAVGLYKVVANLTCSDNYYIDVTDDAWVTYEFEILPTELDISQISWNVINDSSYTRKQIQAFEQNSGRSYFSNLPQGLFPSIAVGSDEHFYNTTNQNLSLNSNGTYWLKAEFAVANYLNYERVTIKNDADTISLADFNNSFKTKIVKVNIIDTDNATKTDPTGQTFNLLNIVSSINYENYGAYTSYGNEEYLQMAYSMVDSETPQSMIFDTEGNTLSGTFSLGGDNLSELKDANNPFYYSYSAEETNSVLMSQQDNNGNALDYTVMSGNLYGNYLVLTLKLYCLEDVSEDNSPRVYCGIDWIFVYELQS